MMPDLCCGRCDYYTPLDDMAGDCLWTSRHAVPECLQEHTYTVWAVGGQLCPTYLARLEVRS